MALEPAPRRTAHRKRDRATQARPVEGSVDDGGLGTLHLLDRPTGQRLLMLRKLVANHMPRRLRADEHVTPGHVAELPDQVAGGDPCAASDRRRSDGAAARAEAALTCR